MAKFKIVFFFKARGYSAGWTETWFSDDNTMARNIDEGKKVAEFRASLLGKGCVLVRMRISDLAIRGDSKVITLNYESFAPPGPPIAVDPMYSNFPEPAVSDTPWNGVVGLVSGLGINSSEKILRGIPDAMIDGTSDGLKPSQIWSGRVTNYINALIVARWGWYGVTLPGDDPAQLLPGCKIMITDYLNGIFSLFIPDGVPKPLIGMILQVQKTVGKFGRLYNGKYTCFAMTDNNNYRLEKATFHRADWRLEDQNLQKNCQAYLQPTMWNPFSGMELGRISYRSTGAPFDQRSGRRKNAALR